MPTLFLDLETYSTVPIAHGAHAYAEAAEVLLVALAWDDEPVDVWDTQDDPEWRDRLQAEIDRADEVVIHNSAFDRTVLYWQGVDVPLEKTHDTMVRALLHSLPGSLGMLCDVMGVPTDKAKDKEGKRLIQLFTKPLGKNRKLDRATRETHPAEWEAFKEYARLDIEAMRVLYKTLPRFNGFKPLGQPDPERELWMLDQRINERGVAVDLELAHAAQRAAKAETERLAAQAAALTSGAITSTTQRGKTLDHLREMGVETEDLRGGTVEKLLSRDDLSEGARALLEIRAQASATSPAKYKALATATSSDERLRGTLQFCGAMRTGRWGGRVFQPQNLPRPTMKHEDIEAGIEAMKAGVEDLLFSNVMELCSSAVRGLLVAAPGKKLVIADLSNIEGRMLAFLGNEEWKLKAFSDFDKGIGHDLYKLAYALAFNRDPETITKDERQLGKIMELALGYQGSVGAFASMAANYGVELPEDVILQLVKAWRTAHGSIRNLWYTCEDSARLAIANPGGVFRAGQLAFRRDGSWLRMRLPSGRYLCYPNASLDEDSKLAYDGIDQYTRKWTRLKTYGGKLVENATQAASRDVFAHGMRAAEAAGYKVVLHVHDELICETPDTDEYSSEGLAKLMASGPLWAFGLPLAAAGFETYRYRKD